LRTISSIVLFAALALGLCGCPAKDATSSTTTTTTTTTASDPAATIADHSIGVPECDNYVKKYMECVGSKVPESARAQYQAAFDAAQQAWRQAATTPEGKAGLAAGCKAAETAAEQAMKTYGCSF
jgi:hypothetical protein